MKAMDELELNAEAIKAANHYVATKADGAPLTEKTLILNSVAHGLFMAVRWHEEQIRTGKISAAKILKEW